MKKILLSLILSTHLISACYIETKKPPIYVPLEKATKIEDGDEFKEIAKIATNCSEKIRNANFYDFLPKKTMKIMKVFNFFQFPVAFLFVVFVIFHGKYICEIFPIQIGSCSFETRFCI